MNDKDNIILFPTNRIKNKESAKKPVDEKQHKLLVEQQKTVQQDMVGRTVRVLFEKHGRQIDQVVGMSDYLHAVHASGDNDKIGCVENVLITKSNTNSLQGKII